MIQTCNRSNQSPAVSERRKATTGFMLDCCTPGRRGFITGATVSKCSVQNCNRNTVARGLCSAHWQRLKNHGSLNESVAIGDRSGPNNPRWIGGQVVIDGRVFIHRPEHPHASTTGYVLRYRLVMEEFLGRFLRSDELVHHKNEIIDDDRLENLQLTDHSEHGKIHVATRLRDGNGCFI